VKVPPLRADTFHSPVKVFPRTRPRRGMDELPI